MRSSALTAAVLAAVSLVVPDQASACGGFFCSSVPIDQSKERIVFALDELEGKVDVHVQIFYQGAADEFAWIVPVPAVPEVGLSTDELFTQLEWRTAPQWNLEWQDVGDCEFDGFRGGLSPEADFSLAGTAADEDGGAEVVVVEQTQVGPYDQVTLQAKDQGALLTWLRDNGYDLPDQVGDALAPYLADGSYFVALKLQSDRDAGDIAPVALRWQGDAVMIPLVLTSIAATPDMRLQPYVFANHRAVPDNYLHVVVNEAAVDWLSFGANYDDVITRAADEAGGQAFATDYSGSTEPLRGALFVEGRFDLPRLARTDDPARFVQLMLQMGFPRSTSVQNLIRAHVPMPEEARAAGIDDASFYNCLDCYPEYTALIDFDAAAFATALDEAIVQPLADAEALFHRFPVVTRLTSSMSPEEMTLDPYFVLNPDMGPVSNQHHAILRTDCGDGMKWSEAPRTLVLDDGTEILVPSAAWMDERGLTYGDMLEDASPTAALFIEDTSAFGQPMLLSDQSTLADDAVDGHNAWVRDVFGLHAADDGAAGGCGCASQGGAAPGVALLGAGLLLVGRRRERR